MSCVILLIDKTPIPPLWRLVPVGGISGVGVEYIILSLKLLCEKAYEWKDSGGVIVNADVETAYDCLHPSESAKTLEEWKVHPMLAAAALAESINVTGKGSLEGFSFHTVLSKCVRQGTIEAVRFFNNTMLRLLAPLVEAWSASSFGICIGPTRAVLYVWADNLWIVGASISQAHKMVIAVSQVLAHAGFKIKPSSLQYLDINRFPSKEKFPPSLLPPIFPINIVILIFLPQCPFPKCQYLRS